MDITVENLKHKHTRASEALVEYSNKISDRLITGNVHKSLIHKFNIISAWVSFLDDKIVIPKTIEGVSPTPIVLNIPQVVSNRAISISIENNLGRTIPILAAPNWSLIQEEAEIIDQGKYLTNVLNGQVGRSLNLIYKSNNNITRGSFSFKVKSSTHTTFTINFPKTSDFNGQKLIVSPGVTNITSLHHEINGGVNALSIGNDLNAESIKKYNKILEQIAIELNISY
jgi:hypothetical protein|tara:strand:+ start:2206 stop:2886 length:681 start_codon:yes stop_codon:yes gene_type:complete